MRHVAHSVTAFALLTLASALHTAHAGTQWKWRTPDGRCCIYSDRPPPQGVPDKDILARPAGNRQLTIVTLPASAAASAAGPAAKASDPELEARRRKEKDAKDAAAKAEEAKVAQERAENCARAREYQRTLDSGVRITRPNAKGEQEVLDDQGRSQESARTQQAVDANCK